jgi:hypothetical protein
MAEGWVLVAGLAALLLAFSLAAVVLRGRRGPRSAHDGLFAIGPGLIALGIIFGDDQLIGYAFITIGVVIAVAALLSTRRGVPR